MRTFLRHRKRRGSALVYVSIMMVAITSIVVTTMEVNVAAVQKAERKIASEMQKQTYEAQIAVVKSISSSNTITLPYDFVTTLNGRTVHCQVTDNSANIPRTLLLTGDLAGSRATAYTKVIGGRQTTHPFYYGLWVGGPVDGSVTPITINNGCLYANGAVNLTGSRIAGDVFTTSTVTMATGTVDRNVIELMPSMAEPPFDINDYKNILTVLENLTLSVLNGLSLPSTLTGSFYDWRYCKANSISGSLSGCGTLVIDGNVAVTADVVYADINSNVAIIVKGDLTVNSGVYQMDGNWLVYGKVKTQGTGTLRIGRGSLATTRGFNNATKGLDITVDTRFWADRSYGSKQRIPGFWPSPLTGILR